MTAVVGSVERAIHVLEILAKQPSVGVSELASLLGIDKSNASRLLRTLHQHAYVRRIPESGRYGLGLAVVHLAQAFLRSFELRDVMRPFLRELYDATHETVSLVVEENQRAVFVDKLESPHYLRTHAEIGQAIPMHAGSTSKALMAHFPREKQVRILTSAGMPRLTPNTITELDALLRQLDEARERGYAVSIEETAFGAAGVAAAVLDQRGEPAAAIGVGGPVARISGRRLHEVGRLVSDVAKRASAELSRLG